MSWIHSTSTGGHLAHTTPRTPPASHLPNTACHLPQYSRLLLPGIFDFVGCWIEYAEAYMRAYNQVRLRVPSQLGVYLEEP